MKKTMVKMSLVTTMLLTTGAYANQIVGADASVPYVHEANVQYGYEGLNMANINVNQILGGVPTPIDFTDGVYLDMALEDTYQSSVFAPDDNKSDEATRLGYVTQKSYPISEPTGLKVVNNDTATNQYKPNNCIMGSSYLGDSNTSDGDNTTYYLNAKDEFGVDPRPVLCSSYPGSSKRFQLVINDNMVEGITPGDNTVEGESIDLVFNINNTGTHDRYQVFQKVTNHTGFRLDGIKVEVLNSAGQTQVGDLNISLGLGEGDPNVFEDYEMAFYPPGLWGNGSKDHLPIGWFDTEPSGYNMDGNGTSMIFTTNALAGNYEDLFGKWQPENFVAVGMHQDLGIVGAEAVLLAYWGTAPDNQVGDEGATPGWYYGMYSNPDENGDQVKTNFTPVPADVLQEWANDLKTDTNPDGKFVIDDIEDLPNLSLNYIINVGPTIDNNITIRFTPIVAKAADQTRPSYFDENGIRIEPVLPTAVDPVDPVNPIEPAPSSGGGGGCTYNPNSKNFDMTFLLMMALGLLYPFRRRFIK